MFEKEKLIATSFIKFVTAFYQLKLKLSATRIMMIIQYLMALYEEKN